MNIFKIIITVSCLNFVGHCFAQGSKVKSVVVEYENFNTESVFAINCDFFKTAFKKTIQTKKFNDDSILKEMEFLKQKFIKKNKHVLDVRGRITFDYGVYKSQYCFDRYGYFQDKHGIFYNKKLNNFLTNKLGLWN